VPIDLSLELDFGFAELVLAGPAERNLNGKTRIATSFPNLTKLFCEGKGMEAEIIEMKGGVELAPKLGIADLIVDLSSSGETLRMNHLQPIETVLKSRACLFKRAGEYLPQVEKFVTALKSVIEAQEKKFLFANTPKSILGELSSIAPGLSGPTIMSILGREDLCAIQVIINQSEVAHVIDQLKKRGASGILITNVEQVIP
jgi:ATP phosphoribosyltransferase